MTAASTFPLADRTRLEGVLDDLARSIHARLGGDFAMVGLRRRGAPLAEELARRIESLAGHAIPVHELTVRRYADDLTLLHPQPVLEVPRMLDVQAVDVVLVDDVVYTGRSLLRAVEHVARAGARRLYVAALCSRGSCEVPIQLDFLGLRFDVDPTGALEVRVPPYEDELGIVLRRDLRLTPGVGDVLLAAEAHSTGRAKR